MQLEAYEVETTKLVEQQGKSTNADCTNTPIQHQFSNVYRQLDSARQNYRKEQDK
jgi:hypothetical protein